MKHLDIAQVVRWMCKPQELFCMQVSLLISIEKDALYV